MIPYKNLGGESGISAYETGPDWITIRFVDGRIYRYDATKPGSAHVDRMKHLAETGEGLLTYINQEVRGHYAAKLR